jgi:tRNA U34 5-methylaminomethyl-2-thiouridine-forming methyltransferase MnmC
MFTSPRVFSDLFLCGGNTVSAATDWLAHWKYSPVGRRSPGTVARWYPELIPVDGALTQWEWEHLLTRAATPYRDPTLKDDAPIILARRQKEQSISILEPTSQWRKRWRR